ncbi:MAG: SRPBCC domain-containing protein [Gemmatimonadota bacterium]|nr:SRPBCC domain-containing protein [Gemmatimonadota bacterium]
MRSVLLMTAATSVLLSSAGSARSQNVVDTSYVTDDGRVQQLQIVVSAPIDSVWSALTTTEGIRSWAVPVAEVDFRIGGTWESSYDPEARIGNAHNIVNRYLAYVPERMIAIQAVEAPPGFPHPEVLSEIVHVIELENLGHGRVRVTESGVGYREGPTHDAVYALFEKGNAWILKQLHRRFADGPVDWSQPGAGPGTDP